MKILLTGSSGFIGRNILESYLSTKYSISAPNRIELDLADQYSVDEYFKNKTFDVVIHSACKPGHRNAVDNSGIFLTNMQIFHNLLKHKAKYGKFINLGSGAIYDQRFYQAKMVEEYARQSIPIDEHGFCKYCIDHHIEHLDQFIDLRIFGIFGKYEDYSIRFISNAICKTIFNLPITIRQNRKFDYLFVDDLYPVLDFFIENDAGFYAYNVTPDHSVDLLEIAQIVQQAANKPISPIIVDKPGFGLEYSGNNQRLKTELKHFKTTNIDKAISELYGWYKNNLHLINKEHLLIDK